MNNKVLLGIIVVIAIAAFALVAWRAPNPSNTPTPTPTPTENPFLPTGTETPTLTDSTTATPTATVTPSTTTTPTVTVTPTPTGTTGTFSSDASSSWLYGVQQQTVGSSVYFINQNNKTQIMKGTSTSDTSAKKIYTSDTAGEIASFIVNGSYIYVAEKRDASNNTTKLMRMVLSSSSKSTMYRYESPKYEITQFSLPKNNDTKSGFYIGLTAISNNAVPMAMYVKNYTSQWTKSFTSAAKTSKLNALAPSADKTKLLGLLDDNTTEVSITIVTTTPTPTP